MEDAAAELQQQVTAGEDLLWGAKAIADFLGLSLTEAQYLIRENRLPVGRLGPKTLVASKRQLTRHVTPKTVRYGK